MLYNDVKISNYTINDGLIQLHYFQPLCSTCFRDLCLHLQPYSNCRIPLLVSRCQLLTVCDDEKNFISKYIKPLQTDIWRPVEESDSMGSLPGELSEELVT